MGWLNFRRGRKDLSPIVLHSHLQEDCTRIHAPDLQAKTKLLRQFTQHVGPASSANGWAVPDLIYTRVEEYPYADSTSTMGHSLGSDVNVNEDLPHCGYFLRGGAISNFDGCDPNSPTCLQKYLDWIDPENDPNLDISSRSKTSDDTTRSKNGAAENSLTNTYQDISYQPSVDSTEDGEEADEWSKNIPGMTFEESYAQSKQNRIEEWIDKVLSPVDSAYVSERIMAARAHIPPLSPPPYIQTHDDFVDGLDSSKSSKSSSYYTAFQSLAPTLGLRCEAESKTSGCNQYFSTMLMAQNMYAEHFGDGLIAVRDEFGRAAPPVLSEPHFDDTNFSAQHNDPMFRFGNDAPFDFTYDHLLGFQGSMDPLQQHNDHKFIFGKSTSFEFAYDNLLGFQNSVDPFQQQNDRTFEFGNSTPVDLNYEESLPDSTYLFGLSDILPNDILPNDILPNDILPNDILPNDILPNDVPPPGCLYCDFHSCPDCKPYGCILCTHEEDSSRELDQLIREGLVQVLNPDDVADGVDDMAYGDERMVYADNIIVCSEDETIPKGWAKVCLNPNHNDEYHARRWHGRDPSTIDFDSAPGGCVFRNRHLEE